MDPTAAGRALVGQRRSHPGTCAHCGAAFVKQRPAKFCTARCRFLSWQQTAHRTQESRRES